MSNHLLKSTNRGIIARGNPSRNIGLRAQLLHLKLGEVLVTRDKDAKRLAGSLSRTTKRVSGTRFAVRDFSNGEVEIQLVRHVPLKTSTRPATQPMRPMQQELPRIWPVSDAPEVQVEVVQGAPKELPINIQLDASDVMELNALRDLFNGFMQRLESKGSK